MLFSFCIFFPINICASKTHPSISSLFPSSPLQHSLLYLPFQEKRKPVHNFHHNQDFEFDTAQFLRILNFDSKHRISGCGFSGKIGLFFFRELF